MTAEDVKRVLGLRPHPREGGWFVRTWESEEMFAAGVGGAADVDGDLLFARAGDV